MEDGVWRTISGRRIFIKEGQSLSDSMKSSKKFKDGEVKKENDLKKELEKTEQLEKEAGRDYTNSGVLKEKYEKLEKAKTTKQVMDVTEDIDNYIKNGLGWEDDKVSELNKVKKDLYDYAMERRMAVAPKIEYDNLKNLTNFFEERKSYNEIHSSLKELQTKLDDSYKFGLSEETQFKTPKQEVNFEVNTQYKKFLKLSSNNDSKMIKNMFERAKDIKVTPK